MPIKWRLAAVASAMLVAAATGIVCAGSASASTTASKLCVIPSNNNQIINCAFSQNQGNKVEMLTLAGPYVNTMTNWYYPTKTWGEIRQADTNLCMQLDNSLSNDIILATCSSSGASYQEWYPSSLSNGDTVFQSMWDRNLCLNDDIYTGLLDAAPCNQNTNQQFRVGR